MSKFKVNYFRYILVLALLGVSAFFSWKVFFKVYTQEDTVNIHLFPKTIGDWTSEEMEITEHEYAILETKNVFSRIYRNSEGEELYFFIVYSENNRKVSHPPEICYTGGGVSVLGKVPSPLIDPKSKGGQIITNKLQLERMGRPMFAYYWFKVGASFTPSYMKQQLLIAFNTLTGKPSSSALIRISAFYKGDQKAKVEANIASFGKMVAPLLYEYLP